MKIDFVSDVTCPWCAIGLAALEQAVARLGDEVPIELRLQPFELNPDMPPEGEELAHYASRQYGASAEDLTARQDMIRRRAAEVGLNFGPRTRVWNTFDAHRLLHWAGLDRRQIQLKHALLSAYHERGDNPGSHEVLLRAADQAGLDVERARAVLERNEFAGEMRAQINHWQALGIRAVPSVILDDHYLIQGGQPVEVFEQSLREIGAANTTA
jgi:predicted DsbA family dithiol-disulfide isomerase